MKKIYIEDKIQIDVLRGSSIDDVIELLENIREVIIKEHKGKKPFIVECTENGDGFYIIFRRLETDKELNKRIKVVQRTKNKKEELIQKRKELYLKLKKEFENKE